MKNTTLIIYTLLLCLISCGKQARQIEFCGLTMGTTYNIKIVPGKSTPLSINLIQQKVDSVLTSIN